jgi:hypothetical protein
MKAKDAVMAFQNGERLKSELMLLSHLITACSSLKGEQRVGARLIIDQCINTIGLDLSQASRDCDEEERAEFDRTRTSLDQVSIYLDHGEMEQAIEQIGCAMSATTTVASRGWQNLVRYGYL